MFEFASAGDAVQQEHRHLCFATCKSKAAGLWSSTKRWLPTASGNGMESKHIDRQHGISGGRVAETRHAFAGWPCDASGSEHAAEAGTVKEESHDFSEVSGFRRCRRRDPVTGFEKSLEWTLPPLSGLLHFSRLPRGRSLQLLPSSTQRGQKIRVRDVQCKGSSQASAKTTAAVAGRRALRSTGSTCQRGAHVPPWNVQRCRQFHFHNSSGVTCWGRFLLSDIGTVSMD